MVLESFAWFAALGLPLANDKARIAISLQVVLCLKSVGRNSIADIKCTGLMSKLIPNYSLSLNPIPVSTTIILLV